MKRETALHIAAIDEAIWLIHRRRYNNKEVFTSNIFENEYDVIDALINLKLDIYKFDKIFNNQ